MTTSAEPFNMNGSAKDDGQRSHPHHHHKKKKKSGETILIILTITAVVGGGIIGYLLRPQFSPPTDFEREIMYIKFPGEIFLRLLKMLILPLIITSLISGMSGLAPQTSGQLGSRATIYYMTTTVMAVILGIILVQVIQPGIRSTDVDLKESDTGTGQNATTPDLFLDLVRSLVPPNLVLATFQQSRTELGAVYIQDEDGNMVLDPVKENWIIGSKTASGRINLLGLVGFSVAFGIIISRLGEKGRVLNEFFGAFNEAIMQLVGWVMLYSPFGIFFLIMATVLEMKNVEEMIQSLFWYAITVLIGLGVHGFIVLPAIYLVFTRKNPITFLAGVLQAILTAFSTASSSATLPVTINCLEQNLDIDPRVTRFVLPIGATINMDGTALYEAVAAIFIAQTQGIEMDIVKVIFVCITATVAAIGAAGIPQAGLVTMVMVLEAVGLPADYVSLILPIDWFLDRVRTAVNVLGDSFGSGIVNELSRGFLRRLDTEASMLNDGASLDETEMMTPIPTREMPPAAQTKLYAAVSKPTPAAAPQPATGNYY